METKTVVMITRGPDTGMRVSLSSTPVIVGRARDAQVRLTDLGVSRRHLQLSKAVSGAVLVETIGEAAPFYFAGENHSRVLVPLGGKVDIGNTTFEFALQQDAAVLSNEDEIAQLKTLFSGSGANIRGLASVYALVEKLMHVDCHIELEFVLNQWGQEHLQCASISILDETSQSNAVHPTDSNLHCVMIPTEFNENTLLRFAFKPDALPITDDRKRQMIVAGRVIGSSMYRINQAERALVEIQSMREVAFGKAREFLGQSGESREVSKLIQKLSRTDTIALLTGETGTGKTFAARLIHEMSARVQKPFRVINCASIPENLVESELFGYDKGAFTGAQQAKKGFFEVVEDGTLFLDEIGDLPLSSQAKLLRALEERQFERVGSTRSIPLRARILTATHQPLDEMIRAKTFRSDLFFRIAIVTLNIPALRERKDDIELFATRFLRDLVPTIDRKVTGFSPEAMAALRDYSWPGNVRELRNVVEHALVLGDSSVIEISDLPEIVSRSRKINLPIVQNTDSEGLVKLPMSLDALERLNIQKAMEVSGGNRSRAAAILGLNRVTLYKKLKEEL